MLTRAGTLTASGRPSRSVTREERFALFSKSGFVTGLEEDLDDNWHLFGVDDLDTVLVADQ